MLPTLANTLLLLGAAISTTAASALPSFLEPRTCTKVLEPSKFYGVSSDYLDSNKDYGPHPPDNYFDFRLAQVNGADIGQLLKSESDLIAQFKNLPCPPVGKFPFKIEFQFEPISDYDYSGSTTIDVYVVDGTAPTNPTWNKLKGNAQIRIGSFTMPQGQDQVKRTYYLGELPACRKDFSLRLSIANEGAPSGSVWYIQRKGTGLRVRYGC